MGRIKVQVPGGNFKSIQTGNSTVIQQIIQGALPINQATQPVSPSYPTPPSSSLTATYIGFGSGANVLTGSADFTWSGSTLTIVGVANGDLISLQSPNGTAEGSNINFYDTTADTYRGFIGWGTSTVTGANVSDLGISPGPGGRVVIGTPDGAGLAIAFAGGSGTVTLTVNGVSAQRVASFNSASGASVPAADLFIGRNGTTANTVEQGANIVLGDTEAATYSLIQQAGGQMEFWRYNGAGWSQPMNIEGNGNLAIQDDGGVLQLAGFRGLPPNTQSSAYTCILADRGKSIWAGGNTITLPSGTFNKGDVITVVAFGGDVVIAGGSGLTLYWANGDTGTGNRTLTNVGIATVVFYDSNTALITGFGLS